MLLTNNFLTTIVGVFEGWRLCVFYSIQHMVLYATLHTHVEDTSHRIVVNTSHVEELL